jgi:hypothetical protein
MPFIFCVLRKYNSTINCGMDGVQSAIKLPKHKPLTNSSEMMRFCAHAHNHRVHTEWQWPLSGVHSIMMVKPAQPGEVGGCSPTPFHSIYHHERSCIVCAPAESRCTVHTPYFSSTPTCTLCSPHYFRPPSILPPPSSPPPALIIKDD